MKEDQDDDYGAELDDIEEKTEKKIENKKPSMFAQAAMNLGMDAKMEGAQKAEDASIKNEEGLDEMEKMMASLFSGMGSGPEGSSGPAGNLSDPQMPDSANMMKRFGNLGGEGNATGVDDNQI